MLSCIQLVDSLSTDHYCKRCVLGNNIFCPSYIKTLDNSWNYSIDIAVKKIIYNFLRFVQNRTAVPKQGASVSACAGLTNQLLSCWVDPRIAWIKHWHSNCRRPVDVSWGTPSPVLLTGAKKSHLGCLISFDLPMGFQNIVVINKIHH